MNTSVQREKHFASLRQRYKVREFLRKGYHTNPKQGIEFDDFLYLILRKAALSIRISDFDRQWLIEHGLFDTVEAISLQEYQTEEHQRLDAEFQQLRLEYGIPEDFESSIESPLSSLLWKLNCGHDLSSAEWDYGHQDKILKTLQQIQDFARLKTIYKATQHLSKLPEEPLFSILQKLEDAGDLTNDEVHWLTQNNFTKTLSIYRQQQQRRKSELEFLELKAKFKVPENRYPYISSPLYEILKKLNNQREIEIKEVAWLKQQNLPELIAIEQQRREAEFRKELFQKYQVSHVQGQKQDLLFAILKKLEVGAIRSANRSPEFKALINENSFEISEEDIQWLSREGLTTIAEAAKKIHFKALQKKYRIVGQLSETPFYDIMLKLEHGERLDPKQVVQLIEQELLSPQGKIAIAHYKLEAQFYEQEYQRTGNLWNLPSASSNWRKADEPKQALRVTENIKWDTLKEAKLKSALWVTRGAAFRDINQLDSAEELARKAMDVQPKAHQPYTLLGAICYDRGQYPEGDRWFAMAEERGAEGKDIDSEIKRIVNMTTDKEKRQELVDYLLKKDPRRYQWAKAYRK